MPVRLTGLPYPTAVVGDTYRAWILVIDRDGTAATADSVSVALTLPDGSADTGTATEQTSTGLYLIEYDLAQSGQHTIVVTVTDTDVGDDVLPWMVQVAATSGTAVDVADVQAYLGEDNSWTDAEVSSALEAERAAQARVCRIPADYPDDLAEALRRRVARNLAARAVPVATYAVGEGGGTVQRVGRRDAEVTRLEAPYLRWVTG